MIRRTLTMIVVAMAFMANPATTQETVDEVMIQDFRVVKSVDPMDDIDVSFVLTQPEDNEDIGLAWKCMVSGEYQILVYQDWYGGGSDDQIIVRYRFDDGKPSNEKLWQLSPNDHRIAGPVSGAEMDRFTRKATQARQVYIRLTDPLDGEVNDYMFSLMGLTEALGYLPCVNLGAGDDGE